MLGRKSLRSVLVSVCAALSAWLTPVHAEAACLAADGTANRDLSIARTVTIDATLGRLYGSVTHLPHQPSFLKPKEVVLTFDDGPAPYITKSILDTLDRFCTKATFFEVGRMALAYPKTVEDVVKRGHTLASHTYSHPYNMPHMNFEAAKLEIERGLAAVASAGGSEVAPFFRFPALADSQKLVGYLKSRNMATLTVDVVTNDSYIHDPKKLTEATLAEVEKHKGGIILFHDIKLATAKALPDILDALQARGYSVVHIVAKAPAEPLLASLNQPQPKIANRAASGDGKHIVVPFYGSIIPDQDTPKTALAGVSGHDPDGARVYGWATTVGRQDDAPSSSPTKHTPPKPTTPSTPRAKTPYDGRQTGQTAP